MGRDQLFKTILESQLRDFLELFFPETAARLDFETLRFLGKEVFANVPEGDVREADVVARLETRDGDPELVLVHVEVEAEHRAEFARRMFNYYAVLRLHYDLPVFPIVLYLAGGPDARLGEYRERLFGHDLLLFRYHSVALAKLPAEEYVGAGPLGAALSALMKRSMRQDRARLLASMLERVVARGLDPVLEHLLVNVIQSYFVLSEEDAERYRKLISRKEYRAVQETELTWADKLMEKGREKGREEGIVEGKRKTLLRLLSVKFGEAPGDVTRKVETMAEEDLDRLLDRVLTATSLDDLRIG